MGSPIYARDLKSEMLTDSFMGKGFEEKLKEAERKGKELIVGEYYKEAQED